MLRPVINYSVCQACYRCFARPACRTRAIVQIDPDESPYIALDRCSGCAACVTACCCQAITLRPVDGAVGARRSEDLSLLK